MNSTFLLNLQQEMQRQAIFELAVTLLALIVICWLWYVITKNAIRDGIRESGLVETWDRTAQKARDAKAN